MDEQGASISVSTRAFLQNAIPITALLQRPRARFFGAPSHLFRLQVTPASTCKMVRARAEQEVVLDSLRAQLATHQRKSRTLRSVAEDSKRQIRTGFRNAGVLGGCLSIHCHAQLPFRATEQDGDGWKCCLTAVRVTVTCVLRRTTRKSVCVEVCPASAGIPEF